MSKPRFNYDDIEASYEGKRKISTGDGATGAAAGQSRDEQSYRNEAYKQQPENETRTALFETKEAEDFRSQWNAIQTQFVDEPRRSVEQADELVAQTMKRLAEIFSNERKNLEQDWDRGDNVSTEDLRLALQRYRSFFDRLLSV